MTHIALQEYLEGQAADWMEQVSGKQYQAVQNDYRHPERRRTLPKSKDASLIS